MNKSISFFSSGPSSNSTYVSVRDLPRFERARSFIEHLWTEYRELADRHFQFEAKEQFQQRFWEMYVAITLKKRFKLIKVSDEGPEFYFMHENKKVWVEAIAPESGDGDDAVTEPLWGDVALKVPVDRILLRYTNAMSEKLKKYEKDVVKGIVSPDDHYIIALNCRGIRPTPFGGDLPYGLRACLAIGQRVISIDTETKKMVDSYFSHRPQVVKKNGEPIPTNLFLDSTFKGIVGLLHSSVDPLNYPLEMGEDFWFLHNPLALQFFGKSPFQFCRQYFYEEPNLRTVDADESM